MKTIWMIVAMAMMMAGLTASAGTEPKPLKVYILVGQSNMQGMARIGTMPYMLQDVSTRALHNKIVDSDGNPRTYPNVHVAAFSGNNPNKPLRKNGPLTVGYGRQLTEDTVFGPELGFGITMYEGLQEPILIIKTAWGGLSLHTDLRSPSAGPYELPSVTQKEWDKHSNGAHGVPAASDRPAWWANKRAATGRYYKLMMECVREVLSDPGKVCPAYDPAQGFELAGLVWFQGWNDMVDRASYPHNQADRFGPYTDALCHFIRDVRKDLNAPDMPVVIGVMGVGGTVEDLEGKGGAAFREAMAAPAAMQEFRGTVFDVRTGQFWDFELDKFDTMSGKYNHQAKTEWQAKNKDRDLTVLSDKERHAHQLEGYAWIRERTKELLIQDLGVNKYEVLSAAKSNAAYHYLGSGKIMAQVGEALAKPLLGTP